MSNFDQPFSHLQINEERSGNQSKLKRTHPHPIHYRPEGQKFDASFNSTLLIVSSPGPKAEKEDTHSTLVQNQGIKNNRNEQKGPKTWYNKSQKEEKNSLEQDMPDQFNRLEESVRKLFYNFHGENALGGVQRFMVDGLASERECQQMIWFAKASAVRGDGYDGNTSPHSPLEKFEGVTLGRAALMVYFNLIELSTLQLFLTLSERGKNVVAAYFNISSTNLHFSYTHLVCRSAMPGRPINNSPFSHQIHADNCWLLKDGSCARGDPAYYWRDYSALLYLNEDFEGGEFIFSADSSGTFIQSSIKPSCGRLVGFSAGRENLHGVRGVEKGSRCALALWFTLDSRRAEWGRTLTEEMILHLKSGERPSGNLLEDLQNLVQFDFKEAQTQILQATSCGDCVKESSYVSKQQEDKRKSYSLIKSNFTIH